MYTSRYATRHDIRLTEAAAAGACMFRKKIVLFKISMLMYAIACPFIYYIISND